MTTAEEQLLAIIKKDQCPRPARRPMTPEERAARAADNLKRKLKMRERRDAIRRRTKTYWDNRSREATAELLAASVAPFDMSNDI